MKTTDILMLVAGVGIVGYLVYKNKDQFTKPLTDADNEPLRASFDTGTNNGQGYQTEEEKPAADPVMTSTQVSVPVKNAVEISTSPAFETGEYKDATLPIPKYNTTTPFPEPTPLQPIVATVSPSAPVIAITPTKEQPTTLLYNNAPQPTLQTRIQRLLSQEETNIQPITSYYQKPLINDNLVS